MRRPRPIPRTTGRRAVSARRNLGWLALALGGSGLLVGMVVAPQDAVQGDAQRLMYLHVPAAWTAYVAVVAGFVATVGYLVRRDLRWDRYARVAAEIGVGTTALTIALGMVWGRATWGVWWAWDPRLVSTALLLVVYCGYLAGRGIGTDPHRTARRAAVIGIAGIALIPLIHFSVRWWRSLHQQATLLAPRADPPIDALMLAALVLCLAAFTATACWLFLRRLAALEQRAGVDAGVPASPQPVRELAATR